jgi:hypothetical protein
MNDTTKHEGSKYQSGRDIVEIAKMIRADIAAAMKAGELPKMKIGVTTSRFAGGQSLTIAVKTFPGQVLNPARVLAQELKISEYGGTSFVWHCEQYARVQRTLEGIGNAYMRSESDMQTDYHNTNFYLTVSCQVDTLAERASLVAGLLGDLQVSKAAGLDVVDALRAIERSANEVQLLAA